LKKTVAYGNGRGENNGTQYQIQPGGINRVVAGEGSARGGVVRNMYQSNYSHRTSQGGGQNPSSRGKKKKAGNGLMKKRKFWENPNPYKTHPLQKPAEHKRRPGSRPREV